MAKRPKLKCPYKHKVIFPNGALAERSAKIMNKINYQKGVKRAKVQPYVCDYCGMWHIGRGPKGRDNEQRNP